MNNTLSTASNNHNQGPILLVDGLNIYVRSFMVNEAINNKSEPIGGVVGFIKSLRSYCNLFKPSKVIVAFEAGGGSPRRKKLYPEYKANRAKMKNLDKSMKHTNDSRSIKDNLRYDENSKIKQLVLLTGILKTMPICQIFVKDVEGDDILGYLAKEKFGKSTPYESIKKIIVSSDKDYYQLLDDPNVTVYDPSKKMVIDGEVVSKTFDISARNYCLAKAIVGDDSDNIAGVPGVGFKSLAGRFKSLSNKDIDLTVEDIMTECQTNKSFLFVEERKVNTKKGIVEVKTKKKKAPKLYADILNSEDIIKRNWKLMYLNSSTMSWDQIQKIDNIVENYTPNRDQLALTKIMVQEGINFDFDINRFAIEIQQLTTKY